jgi:hypothetical protein
VIDLAARPLTPREEAEVVPHVRGGSHWQHRAAEPQAVPPEEPCVARPPAAPARAGHLIARDIAAQRFGAFVRLGLDKELVAFGETPCQLVIEFGVAGLDLQHRIAALRERVERCAAGVELSGEDLPKSILRTRHRSSASEQPAERLTRLEVEAQAQDEAVAVLFALMRTRSPRESKEPRVPHRTIGKREEAPLGRKGP